MVPNLSYAVGCVAPCIGGALGLVAIQKNRHRSCLPGDMAVVVGSCALYITLKAVSALMQESSPFWKGFSTTLPILSLLTGKVIGSALSQHVLAKREIQIITDNNFHDEIRNSSWVQTCAFALSSLCLVGCPTVISTPLAPILGGLLGMEQVEYAAERTREMQKKSH